jgi:hypothetical protein
MISNPHCNTDALLLFVLKSHFIFSIGQTCQQCYRVNPSEREWLKLMAAPLQVRQKNCILYYRAILRMKGKCTFGGECHLVVPGGTPQNNLGNPCFSASTCHITPKAQQGSFFQFRIHERPHIMLCQSLQRFST